MTSQPPRILTEPLARLLASELGERYEALPASRQRHYRAITRKLVWAYLSQKSCGSPTLPWRKPA